MDSQAVRSNIPLPHQEPVRSDSLIRRRIALISPSRQRDEFSGPDISFVAARLSKEGQSVSLLPGCRFGDLFTKQSHGAAVRLLREFRELHRGILHADSVYLQATPPGELARSLLLPLLIARFFGKRIVVSFAGGNVEDLSGRLSRLLLPLLRLVNTIVVPTEWSARLLARYRLPVEIVPGPIESPSSAPRLIQEVQPRLLSFLLAGPESNVTAILRAARLTKQKYPRTELTLIASTDKLANAVAQSLHDSFVTVVDAADRAAVTQALDCCDLTIHNSTDDDLPIPVLNALGLGIPVITCDAGGLTAIIQNGRSGLVFPANDPATMASRIIELIEQPALVTQLSRSGPLEAHRFGWHAVRKNWISLFI